MTTPKTETPVVIYARYSTDRQDARSIDDQVRRCREHATRHGMTVVHVFSDEAMSGAHTDRPQLQNLLQQATDTRRRPFSAVLVDDLSRLSRDLWDMGRIVFQDLATLGIPVIDVMTGTSSDLPHARMLFASMGMGNDQFLQMVKFETHRGLQGRALAGFSTGGRVYGFSTVPEATPQDPEHPRACPVINDVEAEVVRRIFKLYADGQSTKTIAAALNQDGIAAPYDGGHGAKLNGHGWPHTSVRNILRNERYIGRWVWNQFKWVKHPTKSGRRRVRRPESEHVVKNVPELAIIEKELWDAVQKRARRGPKPGSGRPPATGKFSHVFSGLLRCGVCGAGMGVVGQKVKNGVRYAQLGCNANQSRGDTVCANKLTVSEKKTVNGLLGGIQQLLTTPDRMNQFTTLVRKRLKQLQAKSTDGNVTGLERQMRDADRRVRNLTEAIANGGWNDSVAAKLKAEETRLATLKAQVAIANQQKPEQALPSDEVIRQQLWNLMKLVSTDPLRGREALARCLRPFVLTPEGEPTDRHYRATGALNLSLILKTPASSDLEAGVSGLKSCGGRI